MTHSLEGKTALVTAAANGIGRASAEVSAQLGATDIDCDAVEKMAAGSERLTASGDFEKAHAFTARRPMGRSGQPKEIAEMVCYLAFVLSAFTTGQAFAIDGGWSN